MLPVCVYMTFAVKHDVRQMQDHKDELLKNILAEKENIYLYKIEWQYLASASNIRKLSKKFMPDYKTASSLQIVTGKYLKNENKLNNTRLVSNNISRSSPYRLFHADYTQ